MPIRRGENFKKLCSKVASKPNKSPTYYNSFERRAPQTLQGLGSRANSDFFHNQKLLSYYPDFIFPDKKVIIEVDGSIWHEYWSIPEKNRKRNQRIQRETGFQVFRIRYDDFRNLEEKLRSILLR